MSDRGNASRPRCRPSVTPILDAPANTTAIVMRDGRHDLEHLRVAEPRDEHARRDRAKRITDVVNRAEHTVGGTVSGAARDVGDVRARRRRRDRHTRRVGQEPPRPPSSDVVARESEKTARLQIVRPVTMTAPASDAIRQDTDRRPHHQCGDGLHPEQPAELGASEVQDLAPV